MYYTVPYNNDPFGSESLVNFPISSIIQATTWCYIPSITDGGSAVIHTGANLHELSHHVHPKDHAPV